MQISSTQLDSVHYSHSHVVIVQRKMATAGPYTAASTVKKPGEWKQCHELSLFVPTHRTSGQHRRQQLRNVAHAPSS